MDFKWFIEHVESNPFIGNQKQCGIGDNYWNADYWTIEVAKCIILGDLYTIPEKYKNNRNCDINRIKRDAAIRASVKALLEIVKDSADSLLICEVGRGLDIFLASTIKKWKKIYCYDQVNYSLYLSIFDNIDFIKMPTHTFNPEIIRERCIMIMNHSKCKIIDKFKTDNIVHAIIDGELVW